MKKFTLLFVLALIFRTSLFSQGCLPEGISFKTQEEIDNFQTNYPGCTEIEGSVLIGDWEYYDITNLEGLNVLTGIDGNLLIGSYGHHTPLPNLTGLENLAFVGGELRIVNNDSLISLSGLNNITNVYGFISISGNPLLTNFEGIGNLESIDGDFFIYALSSMTSLNGLESLANINGELYIGSMNVLTDISGVENIDPNSITDLIITNNDLLSECAIENFCEYLAAGVGYVEIESNAPGCNNQQQVEDACDEVGISNFNIRNAIAIYPNPTNNEVKIKTENGTIIRELNIYNQVGQRVLNKKQIESSIDVSMLKQGLYVIEIVFADSKIRDKLILR